MPVLWFFVVIFGILSADAASAASLPAVSLSDSIWQPPGGSIQFRLTPAPDEKVGLPVVHLCPDRSLREIAEAQIPKDQQCGDKLPVQRVPPYVSGEGFARFEAFLPEVLFDGDDSKTIPYFQDLRGTPLASPARALVAHGWLRVQLDDGAGKTAFTWLEIGLTSRLLAFALALAFLVVAWTILMRVARGFEPNLHDKAMKWLEYKSLPIRLITNSNGRASLSQLQFFLWTFVIACGGVYVMALNGSLMPLTATALVLLGVTGATAVLSAVADERNPGKASSMRAPGAVKSVVANPVAGGSDLTVRWDPPEEGGPLSRYEVEWAAPDQNGNSSPRMGVVETTEPVIRLTRLNGATEYKVTVFAANPSGRSPPLAASVVTTNPDQATFVGPPGEFPGGEFKVDDAKATDTSITLQLQGLPQAGGELQYRRTDGQEDWTLVTLPQGDEFTVANLISGVAYEFRVRPIPDGLWSTPRDGKTRHVSQWSDIFVAPERPTEIDPTRVQMLIFTVSTAAFVSFKIADGGAIPDIPNEYIWLMGISNGVYLGNKWGR